MEKYPKILFVFSILWINISGQSLRNSTDNIDISKRMFTKTFADSNSVLIEEIIQYWNGTDWENLTKSVLSYNTSWLKTTEEGYGWNGTEWDANSRSYYFYNSSDKLEILYKEESFLNWDTTYVVRYKYDDLDLERERITKSWNKEEKVYSQWKVISNYTDENLTEKINQTYENNLWVNWNRFIYEYDLHNNLTERLLKYWQNNEWENYSSENFIFNDDNKNVKSIQLSWSNSDWDTLNMHTFIYSEFNQQLVEENRRVKQNGLWINDSKLLYDYNENGQIIFQKFQYWDDSILVDGNRNFYEYNSYGNISQELEQGWRNDDWENNSKVEYSYDSKNNLITKTYSNWSEGAWINAVNYNYKYDNITDVQDSNILPDNYELLNNYPNPFNPSTVINYSLSRTSWVTIRIYDLLGKEIITLVNEEKPLGSYKITFDGSNLSSGVYFYRMQAESFISSKKMILLK